MATDIELIYCAGRNKAFSDIALAAGFRLGAQVPTTVYHDLYFCDQDWKRPDRAAYMAALAKHRPTLATVLDWERDEQLAEVLAWAEEAARYADRILIVPKVHRGIARLPRRVGGKDVVLAFSVPTAFGGTRLSPNQFAGWPVHLLGGSPHAQMRLYRGWFRDICEVVSVDGNMHNKLATSRAQFWEPGTARYARDHYWPKLSEAGWVGQDAPMEAFRRSCENIMTAWRSV